MKPLRDYRFLRGICHHMENSPEILERELSFCKRLGLNSMRIWLDQSAWEKDPVQYIGRLRAFMETCWRYGIQCMPILWNGNYIREFTAPSESDYTLAARYAQDVIEAFREEEYLLMWDVINEPMCNDFLLKSPPEEYDRRYALLTAHIRRLCAIVRAYDPDGCLTVGHERAEHCASTVDLVDVISYHDYMTTRKKIEDALQQVLSLARENGGKPVINTETGCVGRANPYDVILEILERHHIGWYLFGLTIEGSWSDIHGLVYPDGTIRDPAVVAAVMGFYRRREGTRIPAEPNREGHAYRAVKAVEDALRIGESSLHCPSRSSTDEILEAAEYCVNLLEAAEMVPMWDPPSARILRWRNMEESERDVYEIRRFAFEMAQLLRKNCCF